MGIASYSQPPSPQCGDDDFPDLPAAGVIGLTDDNPPDSSELLDRGGELIASLAEPFEVNDI